MFRCLTCDKIVADEDCRGCDRNCKGSNLKRIAVIHYLKPCTNRTEPAHHQSQYGKFLVACKSSDPTAKLPPFYSTAIPAVTCEACLATLAPKVEEKPQPEVTI